jgi:hypothetical protein
MAGLKRWRGVIGVCALMLSALGHAQMGSLRPQIERNGQSETLRVQADQKAYAESLKPLTPLQSSELRQHLRQQQFEQRQLQQRQLRDALLLEQRSRVLPNSDVSKAEAHERQQAERQQRQLQLQQQMQRETWPYPRWWQ